MFFFKQVVLTTRLEQIVYTLAVHTMEDQTTRAAVSTVSVLSVAMKVMKEQDARIVRDYVTNRNNLFLFACKKYKYNEKNFICFFFIFFSLGRYASFSI